MNDVRIYVTMGCPYCRKLMEWLDKYSVKHTRVVFEDSASKMAFYAKTPGATTVPQIFLDGERIGGWSDLQQHEWKAGVERHASQGTN